MDGDGVMAPWRQWVLTYLRPALYWLLDSDTWFYRIYRNVKSGFDPRFRRRQILLSWVRQTAGRDVADLAAVWKDGSILCDVIHRACPSSSSGQNVREYLINGTFRHAQTLAYHSLMLQPAFSEIDFKCSQLTPNMEKRLFCYLQTLRLAITRKQLNKSLDEDSDDVEARVAHEYIARGMGLITASRLRPAIFYVYSRDRSNLTDIHVEIRGPGEDFGSLLVYENGNYDKAVNCSVPIEYRLTQDYLRVSYQPRSTGHHKLYISRLGCVIPGSPFLVTVDNISENSPTKRFNSVEWYSEDEEKRQKVLQDKRKKAKVKSRIVDLVTEKMYLTNDGENLVKLQDSSAGILTPPPPPDLPSPDLNFPQEPSAPLPSPPTPSTSSVYSSITRKISCSRPKKRRSGKSKWTSARSDCIKYILIKPQKSEVKRVSNAASQVTFELQSNNFQEKCRNIVTVCDYLLRHCPRQKSLEIISEAGYILQSSHHRNPLAPDTWSGKMITKTNDENINDDIFIPTPYPVITQYLDAGLNDIMEDDRISSSMTEHSNKYCSSHSASKIRMNYRMEGNTKSATGLDSFSSITQSTDSKDTFEDEIHKGPLNVEVMNHDHRVYQVNTKSDIIIEPNDYNGFEDLGDQNVPKETFNFENSESYIIVDDEMVDGKNIMDLTPSLVVSCSNENNDTDNNTKIKPITDHTVFDPHEKVIHKLQSESRKNKKQFSTKSNLVKRIISHFESAIVKENEIENDDLSFCCPKKSKTLIHKNKSTDVTHLIKPKINIHDEVGPEESNKLHIKYLKSLGANDKYISNLQPKIDIFETVAHKDRLNTYCYKGKETSKNNTNNYLKYNPFINENLYITGHVFRAEPAVVVSKHYAELREFSCSHNNNETTIQIHNPPVYINGEETNKNSRINTEGKEYSLTPPSTSPHELISPQSTTFKPTESVTENILGPTRSDLKTDIFNAKYPLPQEESEKANNNYNAINEPIDKFLFQHTNLSDCITIKSSQSNVNKADHYVSFGINCIRKSDIVNNREINSVQPKFFELRSTKLIIEKKTDIAKDKTISEIANYEMDGVIIQKIESDKIISDRECIQKHDTDIKSIQRKTLEAETTIINAQKNRDHMEISIANFDTEYLVTLEDECNKHDSKDAVKEPVGKSPHHFKSTFESGSTHIFRKNIPQTKLHKVISNSESIKNPDKVNNTERISVILPTILDSETTTEEPNYANLILPLHHEYPLSKEENIKFNNNKNTISEHIDYCCLYNYSLTKSNSTNILKENTEEGDLYNDKHAIKGLKTSVENINTKKGNIQPTSSSRETYILMNEELTELTPMNLTAVNTDNIISQETENNYYNLKDIITKPIEKSSFEPNTSIKSVNINTIIENVHDKGSENASPHSELIPKQNSVNRTKIHKQPTNKDLGTNKLSFTYVGAHEPNNITSSILPISIMLSPNRILLVSHDVESIQTNTAGTDLPDLSSSNARLLRTNTVNDTRTNSGLPRSLELRANIILAEEIDEGSCPIIKDITTFKTERTTSQEYKINDCNSTKLNTGTLEKCYFFYNNLSEFSHNKILGDNNNERDLLNHTFVMEFLQNKNKVNINKSCIIKPTNLEVKIVQLINEGKTMPIDMDPLSRSYIIIQKDGNNGFDSDNICMEPNGKFPCHVKALPESTSIDMLKETLEPESDKVITYIESTSKTNTGNIAYLNCVHPTLVGTEKSKLCTKNNMDSITIDEVTVNTEYTIHQGVENNKYSSNEATLDHEYLTTLEKETNVNDVILYTVGKSFRHTEPLSEPKSAHLFRENISNIESVKVISDIECLQKPITIKHNKYTSTHPTSLDQDSTKLLTDCKSNVITIITSDPGYLPAIIEEEGNEYNKNDVVKEVFDKSPCHPQDLSESDKSEIFGENSSETDIVILDSECTPKADTVNNIVIENTHITSLDVQTSSIITKGEPIMTGMITVDHDNSTLLEEDNNEGNTNIVIIDPVDKSLCHPKALTESEKSGIFRENISEVESNKIMLDRELLLNPDTVKNTANISKQTTSPEVETTTKIKERQINAMIMVTLDTAYLILKVDESNEYNKNVDITGPVVSSCCPQALPDFVKSEIFRENTPGTKSDKVILYSEYIPNVDTVSNTKTNNIQLSRLDIEMISTAETFDKFVYRSQALSEPVTTEILRESLSESESGIVILDGERISKPDTLNCIVIHNTPPTSLDVETSVLTKEEIKTAMITVDPEDSPSLQDENNKYNTNIVITELYGKWSRLSQDLTESEESEIFRENTPEIESDKVILHNECLINPDTVNNTAFINYKQTTSPELEKTSIFTKEETITTAMITVDPKYLTSFQGENNELDTNHVVTEPFDKYSCYPNALSESIKSEILCKNISEPETDILILDSECIPKADTVNNIVIENTNITSQDVQTSSIITKEETFITGMTTVDRENSTSLEEDNNEGNTNIFIKEPFGKLLCHPKALCESAKRKIIPETKSEIVILDSESVNTINFIEVNNIQLKNLDQETTSIISEGKTNASTIVNLVPEYLTSLENETNNYKESEVSRERIDQYSSRLVNIIADNRSNEIMRVLELMSNDTIISEVISNKTPLRIQLQDSGNIENAHMKSLEIVLSETSSNIPLQDPLADDIVDLSEEQSLSIEGTYITSLSTEKLAECNAKDVTASCTQVNVNSCLTINEPSSQSDSMHDQNTRISYVTHKNDYVTERNKHIEPTISYNNIQCINVMENDELSTSDKYVHAVPSLSMQNTCNVLQKVDEPSKLKLDYPLHFIYKNIDQVCSTYKIERQAFSAGELNPELVNNFVILPFFERYDSCGYLVTSCSWGKQNKIKNYENEDFHGSIKTCIQTIQVNTKNQERGIRDENDFLIQKGNADGLIVLENCNSVKIIAEHNKYCLLTSPNISYYLRQSFNEGPYYIQKISLNLCVLWSSTLFHKFHQYSLASVEMQKEFSEQSFPNTANYNLNDVAYPILNHTYVYGERQFNSSDIKGSMPEHYTEQLSLKKTEKYDIMQNPNSSYVCQNILCPFDDLKIDLYRMYRSQINIQIITSGKINNLELFSPNNNNKLESTKLTNFLLLEPQRSDILSEGKHVVRNNEVQTAIICNFETLYKKEYSSSVEYKSGKPMLHHDDCVLYNYNDFDIETETMDHAIQQEINCVDELSMPILAEQVVDSGIRMITIEINSRGIRFGPKEDEDDNCCLIGGSDSKYCTNSNFYLLTTELMVLNETAIEDEFIKPRLLELNSGFSLFLSVYNNNHLQKKEKNIYVPITFGFSRPRQIKNNSDVPTESVVSHTTEFESNINIGNAVVSLPGEVENDINIPINYVVSLPNEVVNDNTDPINSVVSFPNIDENGCNLLPDILHRNKIVESLLGSLDNNNLFKKVVFQNTNYKCVVYDNKPSENYVTYSDTAFKDNVNDHDMNNYEFFKSPTINITEVLPCADRTNHFAYSINNSMDLHSNQSEDGQFNSECIIFSKSHFDLSTDSESLDFQTWSSNVEFEDPSDLEVPPEMNFDSIIYAKNLDEALEKLEHHIQDKGDGFQRTSRTPSPSLQALERYINEGVSSVQNDELHTRLWETPSNEGEEPYPNDSQLTTNYDYGANMWATSEPMSHSSQGSAVADLSNDIFNPKNEEEDLHGWIISPYHYPRVLLGNTEQMSIIDEEDDIQRPEAASSLFHNCQDLSLSSLQVIDALNIDNGNSISNTNPTYKESVVLNNTLEKLDCLSITPSAEINLVDLSKKFKTVNQIQNDKELTHDCTGQVHHTHKYHPFGVHASANILNVDEKDCVDDTTNILNNNEAFPPPVIEKYDLITAKSKTETISNESNNENIIYSRTIDHTVGCYYYEYKINTDECEHYNLIKIEENSCLRIKHTDNKEDGEAHISNVLKDNNDPIYEETAITCTVTEKKAFWDRKIQQIQDLERPSQLSSRPKNISSIKTGTVSELVSCFNENEDNVNKTQIDPFTPYYLLKELPNDKGNYDNLGNMNSSKPVTESKGNNITCEMGNDTAALNLVTHWKTYWDDITKDQTNNSEQSVDHLVQKVPSIQISDDEECIFNTINSGTKYPRSNSPPGHNLHSRVEARANTHFSNIKAFNKFTDDLNVEMKTIKDYDYSSKVSYPVSASSVDGSNTHESLVSNNGLSTNMLSLRSLSTGDIDILHKLDDNQGPKMPDDNHLTVGNISSQDHNEFKQRFEKARCFFKNLEQSHREEIKNKNYKSMPQLKQIKSIPRKPSIDSDSGGDIKPQNPRNRFRMKRKKKKDLITVKSAPTSDSETFKRINHTYSYESFGGSVKNIKVLERLHVKDIFKDVSSTDGFFKGIPNREAVLASLNSIDDVRVISPYHFDIDDLKTSSSLGHIPSGFQQEYPYLPTTPVNQFRPRSALEYNLIPRNELLGQSF